MINASISQIVPQGGHTIWAMEVEIDDIGWILILDGYWLIAFTREISYAAPIY